MTHARALLLFVLGAIAAATPAFAQRGPTELGLDVVEENLRPLVEEGQLSTSGIGPVLLVGATPIFEETQAWFPGAALDTVTAIFGPDNVRVCEACLSPRVSIREGRLEHNSALTLPEIARLDETLRGKGAPARSALWLTETRTGVSVRLVRIDSGTVLFAGTFDGDYRRRAATAQNYNLSLETGRRLRGESLTHILIDAALVPGQHVSMDIVEQFTLPYLGFLGVNTDLGGLTLSLIDPFLGVGAAYYRVIPAAWNLTLGAQVIVSVPTALVTALASATDGGEVPELIDPLVTAVLVARWPIPNTNFALLATVSTNLVVGVGITLMNVSFLPFLP